VKECSCGYLPDTKVIGQSLKERLGGVEQEPLKPEMQDLLRELDKATRDAGSDHQVDAGPDVSE
jgi:hypothetical protein